MDKFAVYNAFSYMHSPGDLVVPHKHECYELNLYENGSGEITCGKEGFHYEGQVLHLVAPGDVQHGVLLSVLPGRQIRPALPAHAPE